MSVHSFSPSSPLGSSGYENAAIDNCSVMSIASSQRSPGPNSGLLTDLCVCTAVRQLADNFDQDKANQITPALNLHLKSLWTILAKSKSFSRDIQYHLTPINHRTAKVLSAQPSNTPYLNELVKRFSNDVDGFWEPSEDSSHTEILRRIACISILLRSKLDPEASIPHHIARLVRGQNLTELRHAGRKYLKIGRKLGGIGAILWLPIDIPPSTYERYINMNDEEIFSHLKAIAPGDSNYDEFVQRLIASQLNDPSLPVPYHNLCFQYSEIFSDSERLLLLLHALGGRDVPSNILRSVHAPQRRWTAEGEIQHTSAVEFDLPSDVVDLLSDETRMSKATAHEGIIHCTLEDGSVTWSISPRISESFHNALQPKVTDELTALGLRLICFACPPCYECNLSWSRVQKNAIWLLLDRATDDKKLPLSLRLPVVEVLLFLAERDSITTRRPALKKARLLSRKSLPYYIYASITLFQSFLHRLDGDLAKADAVIRYFFSRNQQPASRLDHALKGRLHISQIDNKIKRYDEDIAINIYGWEGMQPLSTIESEVTFRLQSAVGKYFLSIGDFKAAQESLRQYLHLNLARSLQTNPTTRRLIMSRKTDMDCELGDYDTGLEILRSELACMRPVEKTGRAFVRLILSSVDSHLGKGETDLAEALLQQLTEPLELDDITNQILHMRELLAIARVAHQRLNCDEALRRWTHAKQKMNQLSSFKNRHGFIASVIHISISHIQLRTGKEEDAQESWEAAVEILRSKRCEYWIPVVATVWLRDIVNQVHQMKGWSLRLMIPGKKPDLVLP